MSDDQSTDEPVTEPGFPVTMDLGENGGEFTFHSKQEVVDWLEAEKSHWHWVLELPEPLGGKCRNEIFGRLNTLTSSLGNTAPAEVAGFIGSTIKPAFQLDRVPCSKSKAGVWFAETSVLNGEDAAYALLSFMNIDLWVGDLSLPNGTNNFSSKVIRALIRGSILADGLPDVTIGSELSLDDLRRKWEIECRRQREQVQSAEDQFNATSSDVNELRSTLSDSFEEHCRKVDSKLEAFQAKMTDTTSLYEEKLRTHAAVKYWVRRKRWHFGFSALWGAISLGAIWFAGCYLMQQISAVKTVSESTKTLLTTGNIPKEYITAILARDWITSFLSTAFLGILLIWPIRIFIRNYMSHSHLAADASERSLIIETYLALLNDSMLADRQDLKEMLMPPMIQHIFRHASDGIVKDDALPSQSLIDAIRSTVKP